MFSKARQVTEDDIHRAQDIQFIATLRRATLSELLLLEAGAAYRIPWKRAALGRAIWRALMR